MSLDDSGASFLEKVWSEDIVVGRECVVVFLAEGEKVILLFIIYFFSLVINIWESVVWLNKVSVVF